MITRVLLIPAAGLGSRLGAGMPKLLVPVAGIPMVDRIRDLYAAQVAHIVVVVHPSFEQRVTDHVATWDLPVTTCVQERPSGMLDAVLLAGWAIGEISPDQIWITWCDQVAVHPATVQRLAASTVGAPEAAIVMPTVERRHPYIHLARDNAGRIEQVLHRREGDAMPDQGESDMGLFALSAAAYRDLLPRYADAAPVGRATGERNFLPFIAWVARHHPVVTFAATEETEAIGVNTPGELAVVEQYLAARLVAGGTPR